MSEELDYWRVEARHFVAGIVADRTGVIVHAAPILRYMIGWTVTRMQDYVRRKGWTVFPN